MVIDVCALFFIVHERMVAGDVGEHWSGSKGSRRDKLWHAAFLSSVLISSCKIEFKARSALFGALNPSLGVG